MGSGAVHYGARVHTAAISEWQRAQRMQATCGLVSERASTLTGVEHLSLVVWQVDVLSMCGLPVNIHRHCQHFVPTWQHAQLAPPPSSHMLLTCLEERRERKLKKDFMNEKKFEDKMKEMIVK
ncbi:hypothetical protein J6590_001166 [Homalodisca vitripennis]|nr:hypothetical protein J6590_001166 [Homalodisca vitripennis]